MRHLRSDFTKFDPQGGGGNEERKNVFCVHISIKENTVIYAVLTLKCNKHSWFLRIGI